MKIAVAGYGNLGKAAAQAVLNSEADELVGVFSRRSAETLGAGENIRVFPFELIPLFEEEIDVVLNCTGSAHDLPETTPFIASYFNVVDSFDTHAKIPEHFQSVNKAAVMSGKTAVISVGWDPGLFSLARIYMESVMPSCRTYTFWGRGVSQGHTDAVRSIDGVLFAREYTIPAEEAKESLRKGMLLNLPQEKLHRRVCYVVAKDGADREKIREEIINMPEYFKGYETEVNFISLDDFLLEHKSMAHAGNVIALRKGAAGTDRLEFLLSSPSNPQITAGILLAYGKACVRMNRKNECGCKTVFDVRPADLFCGAKGKETELL
ncbi:MAG: diaminopimelate dehydrogenase [Clostridia bacterium]|nr:diaminopimelate dehydrogenase [Clostridia bacterium]